MKEVLFSLVAILSSLFSVFGAELRTKDIVRSVTLPSGQIFVQAERTPSETSMKAIVKVGDRSTVLFATNCLPSDVKSSGGLGQVFGAAELESGELLLPIGWTNPSGRNINGIAVLDAHTYECRRVIVLPGSVRDIVPLSGSLAAAVLTHLTGKDNAIELAVVGSNGELRAATRYHSDVDADDIEQLALQLRLHRVRSNAFSVANLRREVVFLYEFNPGEQTCSPGVRAHRDDGLVYPVLGKSCGTVVLKRMAAFGAAPSRMQNMTGIAVIGAFFRPDNSEVVVRSGFEGAGPKTWVTIYGASAEEIEVPERLIPSTISLENDAIHGLVLVGGKIEDKAIKLP